MWPSYSYYDPHHPWQPWGATANTQTMDRQSWPSDLDIFFSNNHGSVVGSVVGSGVGSGMGQPLEVSVTTPSPVQEVPSLPSPLTESESGYSSYSSSQASGTSGETYDDYRQSSYPGQVSPPSSPDLMMMRVWVGCLHIFAPVVEWSSLTVNILVFMFSWSWSCSE